MAPAPSRSWLDTPPVLRALASLATALLLVAGLAWLPLPRPPLWAWPLLAAGIAVLLGRLWGLGPGWLLFPAALPLALAWQLGHSIPFWVHPAALAVLLLLFGGGLRTRVPLYNSNRATWSALAGLLPAEDGRAVADLGAGLGGPLAHLAARRPGLRFLGVEASPLPWLVAWLRTRRHRDHCSVRLGSLWKLPLGGFDLVYVFLSPAPMPRLWEKACREMRPGTLLVSNTFPVPGRSPEREIPLPGRRDARLLVYRL